MKTKAVIFARVSTTSQSTDRQIFDLEAYAEKTNLELVQDPVIEIISGSVRASDRDGFKRLLEIIAYKKVEKILVHEVSRLSRRTSDILDIVEFANSKKVSIYFYQQNLETLNPAGGVNAITQMLLTLLAEFGRMERSTLIERVRSGMKQAQRDGKKIGRPKTFKSNEEYLEKYNQIVDDLRSGKKYKLIRLENQCSFNTISKVRALIT